MSAALAPARPCGAKPAEVPRASATPDELQAWLEWAGSKLLSLTLASPAPQGYKSNWPSYAQDARMAYGYTGERLRPALPSGHDIALMDQILTLPSFIKDPVVRRIVNARAVVRPVANTHLYSWTRIAFMLHTNRQRVTRLHDLGLRQIAASAPQAQIYIIRKSFATAAT